MRTWITLSLLLLAAPVASAQPADAGVVDPPPPADAGPPADELSAPPPAPPPKDVPPATQAAPAPLPDQASGIEVDEPTPAAERARWIPRVLLFVPRWTFWLIAQPFRLGAWAYERYALPQRAQGALFNIEKTFGVYPVAAYSTDYGANIGLRVVHYDLFGHKERLKLRANFGGEYQQAYGADLRSGNIRNFLRAGVETRFERRGRERFFGIGNANELETPPDMPLDPTLRDVAVSSRFREDLIRLMGWVDAKVAEPLSLRVSGALALRTFGNGLGDEPIVERFDTSKLVGYDSGVKNVYVEAEMTYDSRRPPSKWLTQAIDVTGWLVAAHLGRAQGIDGDRTAFTRYGGEVQRYFDLYRGTRSLALRLAFDGISGSDGLTDGKISFIDLPRLGGSDYLRGYPVNRFRDRGVALATVEYTWDLGNYLGAYLFIDAGRAVHTWSEIDDDLAKLHLGYGGGVEVHTAKSYVLRTQIAAAREGNLFFELVLSPTFGRRERAGRF